MEKGLGILDSINRALWKKKPPQEEAKKDSVGVDLECVEVGEKAQSEYWAKLSDHGKRKGSKNEGEDKTEKTESLEGVTEPIEKKSKLETSGTVPEKAPETTSKVLQDEVKKDVKKNDKTSEILIDPKPVQEVQNGQGGAAQKSTSVDCARVEGQKISKAKTVIKKRKESVDSRPMSPESSKALLERRRSSHAVNRSGATSPEDGTRRGSGITTPLSFNSIQEKILALSRDSSQADVGVKKTRPKVKKLDEKALSIAKEQPKPVVKEPIKVMPKIDAVLQSKISKFGPVATGVKIPLKKSEQPKPQDGMKGHSVIGGYTIKEESLDDSSKVKKKIKPKAPQPPGVPVSSEPGTPSTDRKVKKKSKAPLPPDQFEAEVMSVGVEAKKLMEEIQKLMPVDGETNKDESDVPPESSKDIEVVAPNVSDTSEASKDKVIPEIENFSSDCNAIDASQTPVVDLKSSATHEREQLSKDNKNTEPSIDSKITVNGSVKVDVTKNDLIQCLDNFVESKSAQKEVHDLSKTECTNTIEKPMKEHPSVEPTKNGKPSPVDDVPKKCVLSKTVASNGALDSSQSEVATTNGNITQGAVRDTLKTDSSEIELKIEEPSDNMLNIPKNEGEIPQIRIEINEKASKNLGAIPKVLKNPQVYDEFEEEFETPKPKRKQYNLDSTSRIDRSPTPKALTSENLFEFARIQKELTGLSKRLCDSSGSESFHTPRPSPNGDRLEVSQSPVMYTSRGEVIGKPSEPPAWTPSPERDLFTPEGSPLSDFSDDSYDHYVASVDFSVRSSSMPRRVYPQAYKPSSYQEDWKDDSSVVFDAGLSFDLCSRQTPVRQHIRPSPAHSEPRTASNSLSCKIVDFLQRTDHIMEEWKRLGHRDSDCQSLVELPSHLKMGTARSKSAANIMIKGFQYYSKGSRKSSRSRSRSRYSISSDRTMADVEELNEVTADLADERASEAQVSERLEAETTERVRLEQELALVSTRKAELEKSVEQMEMDLFYAKSEVLSEGDVEFEEGRDSYVYQQKCERLKRDVEMLKVRLQQQHEDDLEQLVALKKQLERKLADAYEEVEEQRQVAAQWKKKSQKIQGELNDFRLILEEQNTRNNLLEKKQRKFDSEIQALQDELRSEKNMRDRVSREKDIAFGEKYTLEQSLSGLRLEIELKEEKMNTMSRELEDMSLHGTTEHDLAQLRKAKNDLEKKVKDLESELDDMAGQVSTLESAKLKLEMSLEQFRKEHKKEVSQKEEEVDDVRSSAIKKIKALEASLEKQHNEHLIMMREKRDIMQKLAEYHEKERNSQSVDDDLPRKLRQELRKTKALLYDARVALEHAKESHYSVASVRALKNQIEDAEMARAFAEKAKQNLEASLRETNNQLEEANRAKNDAESRAQTAVREAHSLKSQLDESEEELADMVKKCRAAQNELSVDKERIQEMLHTVAELTAERDSLKQQLEEVTAKLEIAAVVDPASDLNHKCLEVKVKHLDNKLEFEVAFRNRLEAQVARLKENLERTADENSQLKTKEQQAQGEARKTQRALRECKEELSLLLAREQESVKRLKEMEKKVETSEHEAAAARNELRLAKQRVENLQAALSGEVGSGSDESCDSDSAGEYQFGQRLADDL